jgi:isocitrate/isopropylmalate dehydrogenase
MRIAVIKGDGVGPEIMGATLSLLERYIGADFIEIKAGKSYFIEEGKPIEDNAIEKIR